MVLGSDAGLAVGECVGRPDPADALPVLWWGTPDAREPGAGLDAGRLAGGGGMTARKAKRYPSLPKRVSGAGGDLTVVLVDAPGGDKENMGHFDPTIRHIEVAKALRGDQRWMVFFHEVTHAALWDSGAHNAVPGAAEEIVCDAIATARLRERFG